MAQAMDPAAPPFDPQAVPIDSDALYRKVTLRLVPLFFAGFVLSYLDRVNISLAKLPMSQDFGLSEHAFAVGASIFFWGYMLLEVPSNLLLQRFGARAWISRIMVTWGLVSAAMMFSRSLPVFYGLRLLLGICEAGFVPGVLYAINQWLPSRRQSGMFALFLLALPVAEVIGAPFSGWLVDTMAGVGGLRGWQWLFLLEGLPTVVLGGVMYALLRNRPADAEWLNAQEVAVLERELVAEQHGTSHRFVDALRLPRVYLLIAIMILWNTSFYGVVFWLPTMLRDSGVASSRTVGLLTAVPFAFGGAVMLVVPRAAQRLHRQRLAGTACAVTAGFGMLVANVFASRLPVALAGLSVAVAGILSLMPIFWTLPGRLLRGSAAAGGLALINACGSLSGLLGVLVIGFAGMQAGLAIFAAMLACSGGLLWLATPHHVHAIAPVIAMAGE